MCSPELNTEIFEIGSKGIESDPTHMSGEDWIASLDGYQCTWDFSRSDRQIWIEVLDNGGNLVMQFDRSVTANQLYVALKNLPERPSFWIAFDPSDPKFQDLRKAVLSGPPTASTPVVMPLNLTNEMITTSRPRDMFSDSIDELCKILVERRINLENDGDQLREQIEISTARLRAIDNELDIIAAAFDAHERIYGVVKSQV